MGVHINATAERERPAEKQRRFHLERRRPFRPVRHYQILPRAGSGKVDAGFPSDAAPNYGNRSRLSNLAIPPKSIVI
jgi:hypothetical protein